MHQLPKRHQERWIRGDDQQAAGNYQDWLLCESTNHIKVTVLRYKLG